MRDFICLHIFIYNIFFVLMFEVNFRPTDTSVYFGIAYKVRTYKIGSYLLHPTTFHPRTLILNFSSLYFIPSYSSFLFNPLDFSFTNSSPTFYPTPCNLSQIICYISYHLNSYSSKWDLLCHTFILIHTISSSSNHSLDFIC